MINRDKLLKTAKNDEERLFISKLIDVAEFSEKTFGPRFTQFLNGYEVVLASKVFKALDANFSMFGGYPDAERKMAVCYPNGLDLDKLFFSIDIIEVSGREIKALSHRDFLGSVLALGLKREKIGDIVISEDKAYIFCVSDISSFITLQLTKVKNAGVKLRIIDSLDNVNIAKKYKDLSLTVASLRLDAAVSAICGKSRTEAADLIKQGKVTLDWECILDSAKKISEKQMISVRGFGRAEITGINGLTKKGRQSITVRKFI